MCRLHGVYRLCRPSASSSLSLPPWEPAMAMRRCEMKKVFGIYNNPDRRSIGYGFPVLPLFLLRDLFCLRSRTTMSMPIKAVIPIFLGLFIVPAQAQSLGPNWETHIVLTELDLDMIHAAVTQQIHGKAVGTTASWSDPASYNWGSIWVKSYINPFHQVGQKTRSERSAMRGTRIHDAHG